MQSRGDGLKGGLFMAASARLSNCLHEVFANFEPYKGGVSGEYHIDFLGAKTRGQFVAGLPMVYNPSVMIDEEYFEWIDLLESVVEARGSYTMLDLGASYGRWSVRAALAVREYHPNLPFHLTAVEAEPLAFQWMALHFKDNAIDPAEHRLVHAAVCEIPHDVLYYVRGPQNGRFDHGPDTWSGQRITKDYDVNSKSVRDGKYCGLKVKRHASGWRSVSVHTVTLAHLLRDLDFVDLIDLDIEEQELPAISAAIHDLNAKVKRLHIGTHGLEIESELRQLLSSEGWNCLADYSLFSTSETPWGVIRFENGVQSWVNPRLS
jgi:FkbM family methyltransferase